MTLRIGRDRTRSKAAQTRSRLAACPSAHVVPASAVVPWGREDATPSGVGSTALRHEPLRFPAGLVEPGRHRVYVLTCRTYCASSSSCVADSPQSITLP
jgi:hypothetical protein